MNHISNQTSHINSFDIKENYFPSSSNIKINNAIKQLDIQIDTLTESIKQTTVKRNTERKMDKGFVDLYEKRIKTQKGILDNLIVLKEKLSKQKLSKQTRIKKGGNIIKNRRKRTIKKLYKTFNK